ncbi:MAG: prolipoprotein diacylglyceryl transferase family protein, partial [Acidimicrobiales bacterium]
MKPIPVSFHLGPTPIVIHTYGIGLAITFWVAYRYFDRRLQARGYGTEWLTSAFVWIVVSAIVGARALHVLSNLSTYTADPGQILQVWHGGLSSFGGLLFAVPTGIVLTRRGCPELRALEALDIVAPVLMAAWGIGRLLGPQLMVAGGGHPTHAWFGMYYAGQPGKRLPVPILQAIDSFAIWGVLIYIER